MYKLGSSTLDSSKHKLALHISFRVSPDPNSAMPGCLCATVFVGALLLATNGVRVGDETVVSMNTTEECQGCLPDESYTGGIVKCDDIVIIGDDTKGMGARCFNRFTKGDKANCGAIYMQDGDKFYQCLPASVYNGCTKTHGVFPASTTKECTVTKRKFCGSC